MTKKQTEAARLLAQGLPPRETAQRLGLQPKTLQGWLRSGEFRQEMARETDTLRLLICAAAMRRLREQLNSDRETVLQHAVHEALGQFGDAPEGTDGETVVRVVSDITLGSAGSAAFQGEAE